MPLFTLICKILHMQIPKYHHKGSFGAFCHSQHACSYIFRLPCVTHHAFSYHCGVVLFVAQHALYAVIILYYSLICVPFVATLSIAQPLSPSVLLKSYSICHAQGYLPFFCAHSPYTTIASSL